MYQYSLAVSQKQESELVRLVEKFRSVSDQTADEDHPV